jgi:phosphoglycerol transferase MdoB-like AlkP superfamily enzyme
VAIGTSDIDVRVEGGIALVLGNFASYFFFVFPHHSKVDPTNFFEDFLLPYGELYVLPIAALLALAGLYLGVLTKRFITRLAKNKIPYGTLSTRLFLYSALSVAVLVVVALNVFDVRTNRTSALMQAASKGHTDTVQALIAKGADVNAKYKRDETALMWAASKGHTDTVQALIAKGADVNAKNNFGGTALTWAIKGGHADIVHLLKQAGAKE